MSIVIEPHLFLFATSELSQDAFICWFLSWAKKENTKKDVIQNYQHIWTHSEHGAELVVQVRAKILPSKEGAYYTLKSIHRPTNPNEKITLRSILPNFIPDLSACPNYKNPDGTNRTAFPRKTP